MSADHTLLKTSSNQPVAVGTKQYPTASSHNGDASVKLKLKVQLNEGHYHVIQNQLIHSRGMGINQDILSCVIICINTCAEPNLCL